MPDTTDTLPPAETDEAFGETGPGSEVDYTIDTILDHPRAKSPAESEGPESDAESTPEEGMSEEEAAPEAPEEEAEDKAEATTVQSFPGLDDIDDPALKSTLERELQEAHLSSLPELFKSWAEQRSMIGRQGNELGELRKRQETLEQKVSQPAPTRVEDHEDYDDMVSDAMDRLTEARDGGDKRVANWDDRRIEREAIRHTRRRLRERQAHEQEPDEIKTELNDLRQTVLRDRLSRQYEEVRQSDPEFEFHPDPAKRSEAVTAEVQALVDRLDQKRAGLGQELLLDPPMLHEMWRAQRGPAKPQADNGAGKQRELASGVTSVSRRQPAAPRNRTDLADGGTLVDGAPIEASIQAEWDDYGKDEAIQNGYELDDRTSRAKALARFVKMRRRDLRGQ